MSTEMLDPERVTIVFLEPRYGGAPDAVEIIDRVDLNAAEARFLARFGWDKCVSTYNLRRAEKPTNDRLLKTLSEHAWELIENDGFDPVVMKRECAKVRGWMRLDPMNEELELRLARMRGEPPCNERGS